MKKKIVITGAGGMLGSDLLAMFRDLPSSGYDPVGIARAECDLTDFAALASLIKEARPHAIIHCAAFTDVDGCESRQDHAFLINGRVTERLAESAVRVGARVYYVSTDYVFDGKKDGPYLETDPVNPLSVYGKSKLVGEEAVLKLGDMGAVVRTSWLYGCNGGNFVKAILNKAGTGQRLTIVNDQRGSPTFTPDLAYGIFNLLEAEGKGVFQVTNDGSCTWLEFAREIVRQSGIEGAAIDPMTTAQLGRPAPRPGNSVLLNQRYDSLTGKPLRPWKDALGVYLGKKGQALV